MKGFIKSNKGIGLVEILITMGVLAVGILGIAGLNSVITRQSQDSKAEAEALAIAQSRIEDALNYTNFASSQADFNTLFPVVTNGNSSSITRGNAVYTRTETIVNDGINKDMEVKVTWTNANGDEQEVSLNTTVSYIAPSSNGHMAAGSTPPLVNAPTGRASLGEGQMPPTEEIEGLTDNTDTTQEFIHGEDRKLADADGNVVLTLEHACQSEDISLCTEFVRIKGTVYLNKTENNRPAINEIHLLASDAAYCTRYYTDGNGDVQTVGGSTTTVETIDQYDFFHYTCYLGGGWHGNIGLLFAGTGNNPNKSHRACTGDPVASDLEPWKKPRVAVRRAYRGMLYKGSLDSKEQITKVVNGISMTGDRIYTIGIQNGAVLGETIGHDFVIGKIDEPIVADDNDCATVHVMMAAGSQLTSEPGDRFAGMPRDFVCLNDYNSLDDAFDPDVFGPFDTCPYDPTNPPASKHFIEGTVTFTGADTPANDILVDGIGVHTSDGLETCEIDDFVPPVGAQTAYTAEYKCGVYDWAPEGTLLGWTGFIQLTYDASGMSCTPYQLTYTTGVTSDDNSGNDFTSCGAGSYFTVSGTSPPSGNRKFASATLDGVACTLSNGALTYNCVSPQFTDTWSGTHTLVLTATSGRICNPPTNPNSLTRTFTYTNPAPTNVTQNVWISGNANGCTGAP